MDKLSEIDSVTAAHAAFYKDKNKKYGIKFS